jgi:hypothetical protein
MNSVLPSSIFRLIALVVAAASLGGCLAARTARRADPPPAEVVPSDPSVRTWSEVWHDARR